MGGQPTDLQAFEGRPSATPGMGRGVDGGDHRGGRSDCHPSYRCHPEGGVWGRGGRGWWV